jgi:hypothetical protein
MRKQIPFMIFGLAAMLILSAVDPFGWRLLDWDYTQEHPGEIVIISLLMVLLSLVVFCVSLLVTIHDEVVTSGVLAMSNRRFGTMQGSSLKQPSDYASIAQVDAFPWAHDTDLNEADGLHDGDQQS